MKLMIVEDDKALAKGIELALSEKENEITVCYDLKTAEEMWESENADLVILDVNLPDGSGYDFLAFVKESSKVPVILLTANDLEIDQVTGLSLGADDYITKPFSLAVLRARIEVQKRRILEQRENQSIKSILPNCYVIENLKFDFERLCFFKGEEELSLSRNEQRLLQIFLKNPNGTAESGTVGRSAEIQKCPTGHRPIGRIVIFYNRKLHGIVHIQCRTTPTKALRFF